MFDASILRELGAEQAHRVAGAVSDIRSLRKARRRARWGRQLLVVAGCALGFLLVVGLVWRLLLDGDRA